MAKKMDYLATHDALTGLVNRREFEDVLAQALSTSRQSELVHVLCYLDLDQFKVVNDTCGHVAGDELLRQLGDIMHGNIRQGDILGRLGGDEFGLLFLNCPASKALNVLEKIRASMRGFRFVWSDKSFSIGISIGLVEINSSTESLTAALSAADAACYVAKETGRNRIHVYQPDDQELLRRRSEMQWVTRIQRAIEKDSFRLRYQPIVSTASNSVYGYEMLLDMIDVDGEVIPPGSFLPAAERYSLMTHIDRWVVANALAWIQERIAAGDEFEFCSINLSGDNLGSPGFLEYVIEQLQRFSLPNHRICFEITETAAISNINQARRFISELKRLGCLFALDDFGSGMSSFAYLKNLPVDYLKIDGNFIRDIVADKVDRAMVESINQVGHVMQIKTIAEFVEDQDILDVLKGIGIDYAQGYYIQQPSPVTDYHDAFLTDIEVVMASD
jgi:Amt family ammonium transporter